MDFLGDLGGLFSALGPFFGSLVAVLQYRGMYMHLTSHMLQKPKDSQKDSESSNNEFKDKNKNDDSAKL